jgi:hypothetical protein
MSVCSDSRLLQGLVLPITCITSFRCSPETASYTCYFYSPLYSDFPAIFMSIVPRVINHTFRSFSSPVSLPISKSLTHQYLRPSSISPRISSALIPVRFKMTDPNQGGDPSKKTYHKKATGNALTTVKNHSKEDDLKLYGSAFWYVHSPHLHSTHLDDLLHPD